MGQKMQRIEFQGGILPVVTYKLSERRYVDVSKAVNTVVAPEPQEGKSYLDTVAQSTRKKHYKKRVNPLTIYIKGGTGKK